MILPDISTIRDALDAMFAAQVWAAEEIDMAQQRRPRATAARIGASFWLLKPTSDLMRTEVVYRAHCRELLDRVTAGQDTRPGTAAECCIALCRTSLLAPLPSSVAGLYLRMWRQAGLPPVEDTDAGAYHEAVEGTQIDGHEAFLRTALTQPWRMLPEATERRQPAAP